MDDIFNSRASQYSFPVLSILVFSAADGFPGSMSLLAVAFCFPQVCFPKVTSVCSMQGSRSRQEERASFWPARTSLSLSAPSLSLKLLANPDHGCVAPRSGGARERSKAVLLRLLVWVRSNAPASSCSFLVCLWSPSSGVALSQQYCSLSRTAPPQTEEVAGVIGPLLHKFLL